MTGEAFAAATNGFTVAELPIAIAPPAHERIVAAIQAKAPVLVGEVHGVEQNPLIAYTLMRQFDIRVLGLEWWPHMSPVVKHFLAGAGLDFAPIASSIDGRITAGHFAVLKALHAEHRLEDLVLFDAILSDLAERGGSWSGRDAAMAERFLQAAGGRPALVMAGNLHTRLQPHQHGVPMGAHVAARCPATVEIRVRYQRGQYFNISRQRFRRLPWPARSRAYRLTAASAWLELSLPQARAAVVPGG